MLAAAAGPLRGGFSGFLLFCADAGGTNGGRKRRLRCKGGSARDARDHVTFVVCEDLHGEQGRAWESLGRENH